MGKLVCWIFKRIDEDEHISVLDEKSAAQLAALLKKLEPGIWTIKSEHDERFQLVENWIFERSQIATKPRLEAPTLPPPPRIISKAQVLSIGKKENRKHSRVNGRLRIMLISGNKSFRSYSRNMSTGGLLLENKIPVHLIGAQCRVIVGSPDQKENLEFQARVVMSTTHQAALEFTHAPEVFINKLEYWMESFKLTKKAA